LFEGFLGFDAIWFWCMYGKEEVFVVFGDRVVVESRGGRRTRLRFS